MRKHEKWSNAVSEAFDASFKNIDCKQEAHLKSREALRNEAPEFTEMFYKPERL